VNVLQIMRTGPVIPVIVVERAEHAVPLAKALVAGGVRVLELTLRTPVALAAIEAIAQARSSVSARSPGPRTSICRRKPAPCSASARG
jgi:2-keto-3-deoxy-6-phosphogluconate aldolase